MGRELSRPQQPSRRFRGVTAALVLLEGTVVLLLAITHSHSRSAGAVVFEVAIGLVLVGTAWPIVKPPSGDGASVLFGVALVLAVLVTALVVVIAWIALVRQTEAGWIARDTVGALLSLACLFGLVRVVVWVSRGDSRRDRG